MPILTIAMPVLNGGDELVLSVKSLLTQSLDDWELLLIDDGSSDGAVERLRQLDDSRLHIFVDHKNRGLAARLNEAIGLARGHYFARMDHDDICHPDRLLSQFKYLESNQAIDLVGARCATIDESGNLIDVLPSAIAHEEICKYPWRGFYLPHPTWMGRTAWFRTQLYAEPAPYLCEDQELLLRTYSSCRFHALPEILLAYRVRSKPLWSRQWRTRVSLFMVQAKYFILHRKYVYLLLSFGVMTLRIVIDILRRFRDVSTVQGWMSRRRSLCDQDKRSWERYILSLNKQE
jgi:glycosyltransferase involved in cell wall biosynthesis